MSAMTAVALRHDWGGYTAAGLLVAFGAIGVVAAVRLLGLLRQLTLDPTRDYQPQR
jgi:hypothetical protein